MKMKPTNHSYINSLVQEYEVTMQPRNLYRQQLANRLKVLANKEYQLMVKLNMLANALKKPAFKEVIESAEYFSDRLMDTLNHYAYHINTLEESNINIPSIVKPCEATGVYSGWVDRVREMIKMHTELKEQIVDVFITFNEADFPETFHFLKLQHALHEDQLWHLRQQIDL